MLAKLVNKSETGYILNELAIINLSVTHVILSSGSIEMKNCDNSSDSEF